MRIESVSGHEHRAFSISAVPGLLDRTVRTSHLPAPVFCHKNGARSLSDRCMILVTGNKPKQILLFSFIGRVTAKELADSRDDTTRLLSEMSDGFRLITDLTAVELIDPDCVEEISKTM